MRVGCATVLFGFLAIPTAAQFHPKIPEKYPVIPSLRRQAEILDSWTVKRFEHVPELMEKNGVDAWLVSLD